MNFKDRRIVAFDTETTGLLPFGGDRVIEVAAVVLVLDAEGRVARTEDHDWLIDPQMPIPRTATEISGISDADVAGKPLFEEVADQLSALFSDAITVAHNYPFDLAFLTQELRRCGRFWPEPLAEVDTVDLSHRVFPDAKSHKLSELCQRLNIPLDGAHRARNDAEACGRAFVEMMRQKAVPDDLQAMLDWANAIGRPPEDGPFGFRDGRVIFTDGPQVDHPVADYPIELSWMEKARVRREGRWDFRYAESTRRWVRRWLDVRGAGRARGSPKGFRAEDWVLDSCIAPRTA